MRCRLLGNDLLVVLVRRLDPGQLVLVGYDVLILRILIFLEEMEKSLVFLCIGCFWGFSRLPHIRCAALIILVLFQEIEKAFMSLRLCYLRGNRLLRG